MALASVCRLTSTSRPLFLKLLMRWFSKPAFSAMAVGFCFGDILCVGRGSAAPVLRLWLLLQREGEPRTLQNAGEESMPTLAKGCHYYGAFHPKNPGLDPFNAHYVCRSTPNIEQKRCFESEFQHF